MTYNKLYICTDFVWGGYILIKSLYIEIISKKYIDYTCTQYISVSNSLGESIPRCKYTNVSLQCDLLLPALLQPYSENRHFLQGFPCPLAQHADVHSGRQMMARLGVTRQYWSSALDNGQDLNSFSLLPSTSVLACTIGN